MFHKQSTNFMFILLALTNNTVQNRVQADLPMADANEFGRPGLVEPSPWELERPVPPSNMLLLTGGGEGAPSGDIPDMADTPDIPV